MFAFRKGRSMNRVMIRDAVAGPYPPSLAGQMHNALEIILAAVEALGDSRQDIYRTRNYIFTAPIITTSDLRPPTSDLAGE